MTSPEDLARILRAAGHNEAAALITAIDPPAGEPVAPGQPQPTHGALGLPLTADAAGLVDQAAAQQPLTMESIRAMSQDEMNVRIDEVQAFLAQRAA